MVCLINNIPRTILCLVNITIRPPLNIIANLWSFPFNLFYLMINYFYFKGRCQKKRIPWKMHLLTTFQMFFFTTWELPIFMFDFSQDWNSSETQQEVNSNYKHWPSLALPVAQNISKYFCPWAPLYYYSPPGNSNLHSTRRAWPVLFLVQIIRPSSMMTSASRLHQDPAPSWSESGEVREVGRLAEERGGAGEIYPGWALIGQDPSRLCSHWLDHDDLLGVFMALGRLPCTERI